eukprot:g18694.t1
MNSSIWGDYVRFWVMPAWDSFRNSLPPEEAEKARLILQADHQPGHTAWMGGRLEYPRLLRPDVAAILVGREVTKYQQVVDRSRCVRSFKAALRRANYNFHTNIVDKLQHLYHDAELYCRQYSNEDEFELCGFKFTRTWAGTWRQGVDPETLNFLDKTSPGETGDMEYAMGNAKCNSSPVFGPTVPPHGADVDFDIQQPEEEMQQPVGDQQQPAPKAAPAVPAPAPAAALFPILPAFLAAVAKAPPPPPGVFAPGGDMADVAYAHTTDEDSAWSDQWISDNDDFFNRPDEEVAEQVQEDANEADDEAEDDNDLIVPMEL